ncbi:hypothetical protein [Modestobacter altitudinis]|uniref:hypothetical protein n=1 Tax=Modestobacter altitudinis TaxID=2213158 RepID=UPI001FE70FC8|nr:hypothetical protein [Modestobacter altitudinis]
MPGAPDVLVGEPITQLRQAPAEQHAGRSQVTGTRSAGGHDAVSGGAPAPHGGAAPPAGLPQPIPAPLPQAPPPPPPALPTPNTGTSSCGGARASDGGPDRSIGIDLPLVVLAASDSDELFGSLRPYTGRSLPVVGAAEDPAVAPD